MPITIQALTAETLAQLNATTIDDFIKYLPNVTQASNGPGQTNIYMRGLSVGSGGTEGSGAIGTFPNVAVYLDDQSAQLPKIPSTPLSYGDAWPLLEHLSGPESPRDYIGRENFQSGVDARHLHRLFVELIDE